MKNAFKEIEPQDFLPREAKAKTMDTISSMSFFMDMLDLFVVGFGKGATQIAMPLNGTEGNDTRDHSIAPNAGDH